MQLFFADYRAVWRVGEVAGLGRDELAELFERRQIPAGTPVLVDDQMRPIEPISSWFRSLGMDAQDAKTMSAYGYTVLMWLGFLERRGVGLTEATESDIKAFRHWRKQTQKDPIQHSTWSRDAAALTSLYGYLKRTGHITSAPWRPDGGRDPLANRTSRDLRVRHMELDQYLFFRDVGFGGLVADGDVDETFAGWRPHRNRAACELALMTGMRIQEWSTLLLPELGLLDGQRPATADVDLARCAKFQQPRSVYVPHDAMELLDPYLLLERPQMVAAAQRTLRRRHSDLFVVDRVETDHGRLRGRFEGRQVSWVIKDMDPELRRLCVKETGDGLEPLALFLGRGGRMPTFSGWDRARWRAWDRMKQLSTDPSAPVMPRRRWVYHDLRHTFALRLLIYLTREALDDGEAQQLPMSTLLDHMIRNPLLVVQKRLGHMNPSSTYRYVRYLKDPMPEVDAAFREWSAAGGASYITIARRLMNLEKTDASQG
ncbi:site-specific integrase [Streptomyces anulatus]